jgi:hypothetical protein
LVDAEMRKRALMLTLISLLVLSPIIGIASVNLSEANSIFILPHIKILNNGTVVPQNSPIKQVGSTYYLTSNVSDREIEIQRDNATIDGAGYKLENTWHDPLLPHNGISVSGRSNLTIKNMMFESFDYGITLQQSSNVLINNVSALHTETAIWMRDSTHINITNSNLLVNGLYGVLMSVYGASSFVNIVGNNFSEVSNAISMNLADNVLIAKNIFKDCQCAIKAANCTDNVVVYYNDFIGTNVSSQVHTEDSFLFFDNGKQGNYWSAFNGTDLNNDGIGDVPCFINVGIIDYHPLMKSITSGTVSFSLENSQDFSPTFFLAFVAIAIVVTAGILVYFKKRKRLE